MGHAVVTLIDGVLDFILNDRLDDLFGKAHFFRFIQHLLHFRRQFALDLIFEGGEARPPYDGGGESLLSDRLP